METYRFAIIAQEHTEHWNLPDDSLLKDCRIFTLSMFRIGEATYCCSLTASTYVDDMVNLFVNADGSPLTDEQILELDREHLEYEGLDHGYISYVDPDRIESDGRIGDVCEVELDPEDYDDADESPRSVDNTMDRAAWDEAREEMSANSACYEPPLTGIIPEPA